MNNIYYLSNWVIDNVTFKFVIPANDKIFDEKLEVLN